MKGPLGGDLGYFEIVAAVVDDVAQNQPTTADAVARRLGQGSVIVHALLSRLQQNGIVVRRNRSWLIG